MVSSGASCRSSCLWAALALGSAALLGGCGVSGGYAGGPLIYHHYIYVANSGSASISIFQNTNLSGTLQIVGTHATGVTPQALLVSKDQKFLLVLNNGDNTLVSASIDRTTGVLSDVSTVTVGSAPTAMALDPGGKFVYVTNSGDSTIATVSFDTGTGALRVVGTTTTDLFPEVVTANPNGGWVYVLNYGANTEVTYSVNASTGLLAKSSSIFLPSGTQARSGGVDLSGTLLFSVNFGRNSVSSYSISSSGVLGALSTLNGFGSVADLVGPVAMAVDPLSSYLYVAVPASTSSTGSIATLSYDAQGRLSVASSLASDGSPAALAVDPDGTYLYEVDSQSDALNEFRLDGSGDLGSAPFDTAGAEGQPQALVVAKVRQPR